MPNSARKKREEERERKNRLEPKINDREKKKCQEEKLRSEDRFE